MWLGGFERPVREPAPRDPNTCVATRRTAELEPLRSVSMCGMGPRKTGELMFTVQMTHRWGAATLAAVSLGGWALSGAEARTFAWPEYVTRYHDGAKVAVAHGGAHGVNASRDVYLSAYIRDPNGSGDRVYGRLTHRLYGRAEYHLGTGSTNSSTYILKRITSDGSSLGMQTRPGVCELRPGIIPNRCADGAWKSQ